MMKASPSAPFVVAEPDLLLELMVIARSNLGAPSSKPFEHQWFLKTASRALTAIIGTEGHQSAHSGTESPEKVPNYVLEAFTAAAHAQNLRHLGFEFGIAAFQVTPQVETPQRMGGLAPMTAGHPGRIFAR